MNVIEDESRPPRAQPASETAIVVPCYNEAKRLPADAFVAFANGHNARLIFVDDGSNDGTAALLASARERSKGHIDVLALAKNVGKGEAVRLGMLHAIETGAEIVAYLDADLATSLSALWCMVEQLREQPLLGITGARVLLHGRRIERNAARHYAGRVFATAASLALRRPYYDTQCGAKVFRNGAKLRSALASPFASPWLFDVELLGRLFRATPREGEPTAIVEHPLDQWVDVGDSKVSLRAFLRAPIDLLRIVVALEAHSATSNETSDSNAPRGGQF